jgi:Bacterial Ig domain
MHGADAASSQNGVLSVGSGSLTYTPPAGYSGSDSFLYYIRDNRGGSATGTVNVTVGATNFLSLVSAPTYSAGQFHAVYSGVPGYPYAIQYAPDLTGPWITLTNVLADANGLFEIIDTSSAPASRRFYRVTYP